MRSLIFVLALLAGVVACDVASAHGRSGFFFGGRRVRSAPVFSLQIGGGHRVNRGFFFDSRRRDDFRDFRDFRDFQNFRARQRRCR